MPYRQYRRRSSAEDLLKVAGVLIPFAILLDVVIVLLVRMLGGSAAEARSWMFTPKGFVVGYVLGWVLFFAWLLHDAESH